LNTNKYSVLVAIHLNSNFLTSLGVVFPNTSSVAHKYWRTTKWIFVLNLVFCIVCIVLSRLICATCY